MNSAGPGRGRWRLILPVLGACLLVVLFAVASYVARSAPFWNWWGWTAVAALAQAAVVLATIGTLAFFAAQLGEMRRQAEASERQRQADYERQHTPHLSLEVDGVVRPWAHVRVRCRLNADGAGVPYNVRISVKDPSNSQQMRDVSADVPYVRAPGSKEFELLWGYNGNDRDRQRDVKVEVRYATMFTTAEAGESKAVSFEQWGKASDAGLDLPSPPTYSWPS